MWLREVVRSSHGTGEALAVLGGPWCPVTLLMLWSTPVPLFNIEIFYIYQLDQYSLLLTTP